MRTHLKFLLILLLAALLLASFLTVKADPGSYDLPWWTVDGGGATFSTGGSYSLGGTIGQPDAGVSSGDTYTLAGGFWPGAEGVVSPSYHIYLPLVIR